MHTASRKHHFKKTKPHKDHASAYTDAYVRGKVRKINSALESDPVDVDTLKRLMVSGGGCVSNDIRCKVWPKLLNVNVYDGVQRNITEEQKEFENNKWWTQVNLDVNRSQRRFAKEIRASRRKVLQQQLLRLIMRVLCKNSHLHYFQGYHDIAVTFLRVVGERVAVQLLDTLSNTYLRDFMDKNMARTNKILSFFYPILSRVDPELEEFLVRSDVGTIFALSWLITWFGHDVNTFEAIVRMCDLFLATHPIMPIYFAVTMVMSRRSVILSRECDMAMVHQCLSKLPSTLEAGDVERLVTSSYALYTSHPPESLRREISTIRQSDSISLHSQLTSQLYQQRPDTVLRRRKKLGRYLVEQHTQQQLLPPATPAERTNNPFLKAAVWTVTVSMGVMTFLVINAERWLM